MESNPSIPDAKFWIPYLVNKLAKDEDGQDHPHKKKLDAVHQTASKIARYRHSVRLHHDSEQSLHAVASASAESQRKRGSVAQAGPSPIESESVELLDDLEKQESLESLKKQYQEGFFELQEQLGIDMSEFPLAEEQILLDVNGEIVEGLQRQDSDEGGGNEVGLDQYPSRRRSFGVVRGRRGLTGRTQFA